MPSVENICQPDLIAAYVDGELEAAAHSDFEQHLKSCRSCSEELRTQRRLMCELDSAFAQPLDLDVPRDFAQVVAVQAKSDMRGARSRRERRRALSFCLLLALASFALLGATAGRSVLMAVQAIGLKVVGVAGLLAKALYDAAAGLSVLLRVTSGALLPDAFAVLVLLLLLLAALVLTILISAYHRYRGRGVYE
jgi:anti-sigma factor RsiW